MISRQTITLVWCTLFLFSYSLVTPIWRSINPNHLLRLFSAVIIWRQYLASLLSFVQVCCRLIQEDTAAAVVSLCMSYQLSAAPLLLLHHDLESGVPLHLSLPFASVTLLSLDKHHVFFWPLGTRLSLFSTGRPYISVGTWCVFWCHNL